MTSPKEDTSSWLICTACGTQFPTSDKTALTRCFVCDDPRQFTPPTGQAFTSLGELRASGHKNIFTPLPADPDVFTSIHTQPKVGIGQRAILVKTPEGNVLWDCITLLDDETIAEIRERGGLKAIVISHPHYYSTHLEWARAFGCPVYLAAEDKKWLAQRGNDEAHGQQIFIEDDETEIDVLGTKVLKLGGHFPGSLVMLYRKRLLIADTLVTTPAGLASWDNDAAGAARDRPEGMNSFVFMWSIPNMIPLAPDDVARMWDVLKGYEFESTHGAFVGIDIVKTPAEMRRRVLDSMKIQVAASGHPGHRLLKEVV